MSLLERWVDWRTDQIIARRDREWAARARAELWWRWREACTRARIPGERQIAPAAGHDHDHATPHIIRGTIDLDADPVTFLIDTRPGITIADLRDAGDLLAEAMGCARIRFTRDRIDTIRVELLAVDPLTQPYGLDELPAGPGLVLGRDEYGIPVSVGLDELPHLICQGSTGSGKSTWCYGVLAQLARRPDTAVAMVDPSGLLARAWPTSPWRIGGVADVPGIEKVLAAVVDEMDARIAALPADRDAVEITPEMPALVVVAEEWPAVLRVADLASSRNDKIGDRIRGHMSRLLAEGRKAGVRVIMQVQRAEAAVVGALERSNAPLRLSFRTDTKDSVKLLHTDVDDGTAAAHATAPPGAALLSGPGLPLGRVRAPLVTYPEYVTAVASAA